LPRTTVLVSAGVVAGLLATVALVIFRRRRLVT